MKNFKLKLVHETKDFDSIEEGKIRFVCSSGKCKATNFLSSTKYGRSSMPKCRVCGAPLIDPNEKVAVSKPTRICARCGCKLSISNKEKHCRPCQSAVGRRIV